MHRYPFYGNELGEKIPQSITQTVYPKSGVSAEAQDNTWVICFMRQAFEGGIIVLVKDRHQYIGWKYVHRLQKKHDGNVRILIPSWLAEAL
jgi:hypothetical protein